MKIAFVVALSLLATPLPSSASDICPALPLQPQYSADVPPREGCACGSVLKNLIVTLNKTFKIGAACNLRWMRPDNHRTIDLKVNTASLDDYTDGDLPRGQILLTGNSTLTGRLTYNLGVAGDLRFAPEGNPIAASGTAFSRVVGELKLARPYSPAEFEVPGSFEDSCWSATATINVKDIWVTIGDSDEAGAYPAQYRLVSVINHKAQPCG